MSSPAVICEDLLRQLPRDEILALPKVGGEYVLHGAQRRSRTDANLYKQDNFDTAESSAQAP